MAANPCQIEWPNAMNAAIKIALVPSNNNRRFIARMVLLEELRHASCLRKALAEEQEALEEKEFAPPPSRSRMTRRRIRQSSAQALASSHQVRSSPSTARALAPPARFSGPSRRVPARPPKRPLI